MSAPLKAASSSSLSPLPDAEASAPSTTTTKRGKKRVADPPADTAGKGAKRAKGSASASGAVLKQELGATNGTADRGTEVKATSRQRKDQAVKKEEDSLEVDRAADQANEAEVSKKKRTRARGAGVSSKDKTVKAEEATKHEDADLEEETLQETKTTKVSTKKKRAKTATKGKTEDEPIDIETTEQALAPPKKKRIPTKGKGKQSSATEADTQDNELQEAPPPKKRPRKTAEQKAAEAMPLATRTANSAHNLGAHVSAAGGVHNALTAAVHIGGNALALFLKSQRKWENPALKDEHATAFTAGCATHGYAADKHVLPHGSYLVNLANPDPVKVEQAYASFLEDLRRCETLEIALYNFHPGNTNGTPKDEAIARLAAQLNRAHKDTAEKGTVVTVLENMAAPPTSNTIGSRFEDLRDVIALIKDKKRVGVCLDTCHTFAAGYDLRSPAAFKETMAQFDSVVGFQYLRALHINDSKGVLGSHRDLHQNIGVGFLGLRAFHNVMNEPRFRGLPMILETPINSKSADGKEVEDRGVWAREIKFLEGLVGMDVEGEEFGRLEAELAEKGVAERGRLQEQFDRKEAEKASGKGKKRKGKKGGESSEGEGSE